MPFLESDRDRASLLILILGICILVALAPFASGILGGPVLFVMLAPLHDLLTRWIRPTFSALLVVFLALAVLVIPTVWITGLLVGQAQSLATGVIQGPILDRLSHLTISGVPIGPRLVQAGEELVSRIASSVFGLVGTATRIGFNSPSRSSSPTSCSSSRPVPGSGFETSSPSRRRTPSGCGNGSGT
jgi:predicted PurR-regulated permease PerM